MVCSTSNTPEYSRALELFRTIYGRVFTPMTAERLWETLSKQDRQRLGGDLKDAYVRYGNAVGMWRFLRGVSRQRAIMDVAKEVNHITRNRYQWLLRMAGEVSDDLEEVIQRAIAARHLVLVDNPENPRAAHWNGDLIEIDWFRFEKPWLYFWKLARGAKAGRPIDRFAFGSEVSRDYLTKMKSRLTNLPGFPVDLGDMIVSVGHQKQTFDLERERIRVIEMEAIEIAREYLG